jgi:hypothetical protein
METVKKHYFVIFFILKINLFIFLIIYTSFYIYLFYFFILKHWITWNIHTLIFSSWIASIYVRKLLPWQRSHSVQLCTMWPQCPRVTMIIATQQVKATFWQLDQQQSLSMLLVISTIFAHCLTTALEVKN